MGEPLGTMMASSLRPRHGGAGVDQRRAGGLGKDGRRFTDVAKVDRADVQRFQLHRAGVELGPGDADAQRGRVLFQRAAAFEDGQPAFLVADAQRARRPVELCQLPVWWRRVRRWPDQPPEPDDAK